MAFLEDLPIIYNIQIVVSHRVAFINKICSKIVYLKSLQLKCFISMEK